ncbi:MSHA biogenesis protein MshJ [Vibrio cincinnatiensis]|uniref:MSHA biogenesis protein MshJ n=1 Tax=Vibrio cincinnatiensis DSM 19608 TaxID=1123491 RepID=A0A1T4QEQ1_VIBCI|nr:type II secretion system protein GspM [Vibrio cincinnatiensis]MCG3721785.1 MSHA biogenesis protein MshJ [Vibrio cincinnatiensis]MCG3733610.1 MSHA biogenesis protein MshJ [Vibrio cincinnatiensis]MCG3737748.1 MSHA biogenesis protein MshJ [Vibrio cincinnatiensis]MCG3741458.1 MSHA biogenesis protein MshJ [Vibrio cincinnatiensis]MCG3748165.1 MSHA biogenesis protein MshJ [Vibrio cincinnatiensis]
MKQRWKELSQLFNQRSIREKWLIAGCGFVLVVMSLQMVLIDPLLANHQRQSRQLSNYQSSNQSMKMAIQQLQHELSKNPDAEIDIELAQLQSQNQQLTARLDEVMETLVSPSQMAQVLQDVLDKSNKLKLVSLASLPAEPINPPQEEGANTSQYFVHPVRIELTGNYFAIRDYLAALENLPVNYYWRRFHYQVVQYPQATLVLEVYTLGSRKEFIGG